MGAEGANPITNSQYHSYSPPGKPPKPVLGLAMEPILMGIADSNQFHTTWKWC